MFRLVAVLMILVVFGSPAITLAQEPAAAVLDASKTTPLVGEPFTLILRVRIPGDAHMEWPDIPDNWGALQILHRGELKERIEGAVLLREQDYMATIWTPGDFMTPALQIKWHSDGDLADQLLDVPVVYFSVPSVLGAGDESIRPYRRPLSMPQFPIALLISLLAGGLASLMVWRVHQRRRTTGNALVSSQTLSASAHLFLEQVGVARLGVAAQPAGTVVAVADQFMRYVCARFGLSAEGVTVAELLEAVDQNAQLSPGMVTDCRQLLTRAELVKYAALEPSVSGAEQYITRARRWVLAAEESSIIGVE